MKKIMRTKAVGIMALASLAFTIGGTLWVYFALRSAGSTPLILHFNDLSGITSVGSLSMLVLTGIFGICITVINYVIAIELDLRDKFLGKLASAATLIFALLLFLSFAAIINVN